MIGWRYWWLPPQSAGLLCPPTAIRTTNPLDHAVMSRGHWMTEPIRADLNATAGLHFVEREYLPALWPMMTTMAHGASPDVFAPHDLVVGCIRPLGWIRTDDDPDNPKYRVLRAFRSAGQHIEHLFVFHERYKSVIPLMDQYDCPVSELVVPDGRKPDVIWSMDGLKAVEDVLLQQLMQRYSLPGRKSR